MGRTSLQKWNGPHLNPLDFGIWSYIESKVSTVRHQSLEALKVKLRKEWAKIPRKSFVTRVRLSLSVFNW